jgi:RND family efflux transporter MFP subunit
MNRASSPWVRRTAVAVVACAVVAAGSLIFSRGKPSASGARAVAAENPGGPTLVEVARPRAGGLERTSTQPGTVEPFEAADLYAKVSGYLVEQTVDIGSHVKAGDVLARISVPEYEKQVLRDTAQVRDADAKVKQMEAHLNAAKAEAKAADAAVALAKVLVRAKTSYRVYRGKQRDRIKELARKEAIEPRVADEQEDFYLFALEAENAAKEGVNAAEERSGAARARLSQAEADLDEARADVSVAAATLERSKVLLEYTVITSPYDGVVTRRTYSPGKDGRYGAFVKAADQGGNTPLLTVERTDIMRVVTQVPDRDVPYVHQGAPAVVEIDALPGVVFETHGGDHVEVSRWSEAEDPATRTMRTEVDVKNPKGTLRTGMYGRVTLHLGSGPSDALRVPSTAMVGKAEGGHGMVRVVRDGKAQAVPVRYATDNGVDVEIVAGLAPSDEVIVRANGPVQDGTPVVISESK